MTISKSVPFTLTVTEVQPEGDFFPAIDPVALTVPRGAVATYQIGFDTTDPEFLGAIELSVPNLPEGGVAVFNINPAFVSDAVVLTIETDGISPGSYDLVLEAVEVVSGP